MLPSWGVFIYLLFSFWTLLITVKSQNRKQVFPFSPVDKKFVWGLPGGSVVKRPPANAGDAGLTPGPERFHLPQGNEAHAPQLLSLCPGAREQQLLKPACARACAPWQRPHSETLTLQLGSSPHLPQLEKSPPSSEDLAQPKINK